jgi:hypothetical protein
MQNSNLAKLLHQLDRSQWWSIHELRHYQLAKPLVDLYSSQEVGCIALQCPGNDHYQVMSEDLIVEVIDEHGQPCTAGQIGLVEYHHQQKRRQF